MSRDGRGRAEGRYMVHYERGGGKELEGKEEEGGVS